MRDSQKVALPLAAVCAVVACQPKEQPTADQQAGASAAPTEAVWTVTSHGYGPIRVGMTLDEAAAAGGRQFGEPQMGSSECDYFLFADDTIRGSVHFMVIAGRIARTDVNDSTVRTSLGARVGDTEQRILELYSGRVTVQPHKYTDGHYLVVAPENGDSMHALIFETDSGQVTTYRSGRRPEVEYIEGCS